MSAPFLSMLEVLACNMLVYCKDVSLVSVLATNTDLLETDGGVP